MSDESKVSKADILEQMQAGHRARIDGAMLDNLKSGPVEFHQVMPDSRGEKTPTEKAQVQPEGEPSSSYETLLEQMRGVYASSWENCSCGSKPAWNGGYNHFYDPCSGADNPLQTNCPVYDCDNTCCNDKPHHPHHPKPPKPPYYPEPDCGCTTTTCYDDDTYYLKKMSDQLNRVEALLKENYTLSQQMAAYLIEYGNKIHS